MFRKIILTLILFLLTVSFCFGQASALRDYVGLISISYHPDIVDIMKKFQKSLENKGYSKDARAIDVYLQGLRGSGFVYVAPDGSCYILTNEHVVTHADTLSITFEKQDGAKTTYDNLKVFYVDEETDLAILSFNDGAKPFTRGLSFNTAAAEEGSTVFAAGFPALGPTAAWQYTQGIISNAAVRLPKNSDSDEVIGPFIQHSAQVDPGNSGGPLLVARQGVPTNHAVIGINTLSARWRQAANYAIPIDQVNAFLAVALKNESVNEQEVLAKKVDSFVKGLGVNRAVYHHIAEYISNGCVGTNAEHAIVELVDKGGRTVIQDIDNVFSNSPVDGMRIAVAWLIENTMRAKSTSIRASVESIDANDKGGFTVSFNVNGQTVKSEWVKEYGIWRLETYGEVVSGNKAMVEDKKKRMEQSYALVTDYVAIISGGYFYSFENGSGINLSLSILSPFYVGFQANIGFEDEYFQVGVYTGYFHPIRLTSVAFMPYGQIGGGPISTKQSKANEDEYGIFDFAIGLNLQAGLMMAFSGAPRLIGKVYYQYHYIFIKDDMKSIKDHQAIGLSIGYGF
jgi:serine protease Do